MSILRNNNVAFLCGLFSSMSHVEFKKRPCPMSLHFHPSCRMPLSPMSHVKFKKCSCRPVNFSGQMPPFTQPFPPGRAAEGFQSHLKQSPFICEGAAVVISADFSLLFLVGFRCRDISAGLSPGRRVINPRPSGVCSSRGTLVLTMCFL